MKKELKRKVQSGFENVGHVQLLCHVRERHISCLITKGIAEYVVPPLVDRGLPDLLYKTEAIQVQASHIATVFLKTGQVIVRWIQCHDKKTDVCARLKA